tara:strand:+ start:98 stop:301 length:204 start_codon:yes stop_codon:yes gene_type:complete
MPLVLADNNRWLFVSPEEEEEEGGGEERKETLRSHWAYASQLIAKRVIASRTERKTRIQQDKNNEIL